MIDKLEKYIEVLKFQERDPDKFTLEIEEGYQKALLDIQKQIKALREEMPDFLYANEVENARNTWRSEMYNCRLTAVRYLREKAQSRGKKLHLASAVYIASEGKQGQREW